MTGKNDVTNLILYDSIEEKAWDKDGNNITKTICNISSE